MTWVTGNITNGWTSSAYYGFGILFENLPTTGESGGSPLLNDGGAPGDEVRWELLTVTGLTIDEFNEDGSFVSTGTGSFTYRSYINNVASGDFAVTVSASGAAYTITCDLISDTHTANEVMFYRGYNMAADAVADSHIVGNVSLFRGYNLIAETVIDSHAVNAVQLTYTTPSGTAYSITCESITDNNLAGALLFNRGYYFVAGQVAESHQALPVILRYSGEEIALMGSYSVNYKQSDVAVSYEQQFTEVTYGGG